MLAWEGDMRCARRDLQKERRVPVCRGRLSPSPARPTGHQRYSLSINTKRTGDKLGSKGSQTAT